MAEGRRGAAPTPSLGIEQILFEAQNRWLRPLEICEVLRNCDKFQIAPEPPDRPPSGSLFLFDRKKLRYFRKDGHNWRKKKDGKTVREAHEKLKAGSIDVLHCYYAHGEENENFQRRSYWMLEEELMHMVLVHYRDIKGNITNSNPEAEGTAQSPSIGSILVNSSIHANYDQSGSSAAGISDLAPESEDPELADNHQASSRFHSLTELQQYEDTTAMSQTNVGLLNSYASGSLSDGDSSGEPSFERNVIYFKEGALLKEEVLKKTDSFSQWMSKELEAVDEAHARSISEDVWTSVEDGDEMEVSTLTPQERLDDYVISPSLSQDQLFSIHDFAPNWAYADAETKVLVMGTFLKDNKVTENHRWSLMFGEVEVPAEVLGEGVLRCYTPAHKAGRVPFYVTYSNRLACSEVREFEFRASRTTPADHSDSNDELSLKIRLGKFLSIGFYDKENYVSSNCGKDSVKNKINLLLKDSKDELLQMLLMSSRSDSSLESCKEQLLQSLLKDQLHTWLLRMMADDCKGPNILDKEGQGVIHLVAALGYDWALEPIIGADVNINFRDVHGWTPLHWAASFGRERTVATLVSLGGASGALTDPTPEFLSGRTPADLASINGHKGISGFLAESAITTHLSNITLKVGFRNVNELDSVGEESIPTIADRSSVFHGVGDMAEGLSIKDSLAAVCNATQAAARIHQVFRVQSFQRQQVIEYESDSHNFSDEQAISLIAMKPSKPGQNDLPANIAAIRIQNKYRSWKRRKEFQIVRNRIVKIQALVRGHQVRNKYKKIIWSVGIMEKVILRWRRKGCGLRGFRSEALAEGSSMQTESSNKDDYDFLREGRKQTEARLDKALARVKSMVQYPEARDQYSRLLAAVTEIQEKKLLSNEVLDGNMNDDMIDDLESLMVNE